MKKTIFIAIAMLLTLGFTAEAQAKKRVEKVVLNTNIHCHKCQNKIENKIPFEKGIKDLVVDLETKKVTVYYDPSKTDAEQVRKALENLGYKVEKENTATEEKKEGK